MNIDMACPACEKDITGYSAHQCRGIKTSIEPWRYTVQQRALPNISSAETYDDWFLGSFGRLPYYEKK